MTDSSNPDEIRADIERTRAELSRNVDTLGDTVNPKNIATRQVDRVKDRARDLRDSIMGSPDDPYDQAVSVVLRDGKASTSYIQDPLGIGYNKAARLVEKMEKEGIVGPANHEGEREIRGPTGDDKR